MATVEDMTPREFFIYFREQIKIKSEKIKYEKNLNTINAWQSAYFNRVKKFPSLKKYLEDYDEIEKGRFKNNKQTPEQMFENVKKINKALGG